MSKAFPYTDAQGRSFQIDSHGNKLYGVSPQQANVNAAWMAYWNDPTGNAPKPLTGTYFTGSGQFAKEAPDAVSRQAALDFLGAPTPTTATTTTTASLLDVMDKAGVRAERYKDVLVANGGRPVVDAGGTIKIPAEARYGGTPIFGGQPSTNALNAAAGTGQGASGALSAFPRDERNYSLNGSPVNQHNQTPFERDLAKTGLPAVWNDIGAAVRFQKANIAKVIGGAQGVGREYVKSQEELLWNIKNTASLYFTGQGAPPLVRGGVTPPPVVTNPVNTGWQEQFVPKDERTDSLIAQLPAEAKEERNYLLATDLPTDKFALERIEQVKALRAADLVDDLPESIPLQLATLAFGEYGINKLLAEEWIDGKWVIEGQSLVWKPDSATPTPASNSEPWNGIYQIPIPESNTGGGGGGGTSYAPSTPKGVAYGVLNLRLATG